MVALDSPLTDEKLDEIGQVWARSIETALSVAGVSDEQGLALLNVLYNRAHNDNAKTDRAMAFWKMFNDVEDLNIEVNLETQGVVGRCTHVWQINSRVVGFVVDGRAYTNRADSPVRWWRKDVSDSSTQGVNTPITLTQHINVPEKLSAVTIYQNIRGAMTCTPEDYMRAGTSSITSTVTAAYLVDNFDLLHGRTVEVRKAASIHAANVPNVKGVLLDAHFDTYGVAQFNIGGIKCADNPEAECLLWEPLFCGHVISSERFLRCAKLNNHRGEHSPVRHTN